jgi:hypothetical protein
MRNLNEKVKLHNQLNAIIEKISNYQKGTTTGDVHTVSPHLKWKKYNKEMLALRWERKRENLCRKWQQRKKW